LIMHLDLNRTIKFNKGEKIEVTQEELDTMGLHRWLIVHDKVTPPKKYAKEEIKEEIKEEGEIK